MFSLSYFLCNNLLSYSVQEPEKDADQPILPVTSSTNTGY